MGKGFTDAKPLLFAVISEPSATRWRMRIALFLPTHPNAKVLLLPLKNLAWTLPRTFVFGSFTEQKPNYRSFKETQ
jgi:hypothetical protein